MGLTILSPKTHGILDYAAVLVFAIAPTLFSFGDIAAYICYALAVAHLIVTLTTDYPMGIAGILSFTLHGMIELLVAIVLIVMPWFVFPPQLETERLFFLVAGVGLLVVWFITDYQAAANRSSTR